MQTYKSQFCRVDYDFESSRIHQFVNFTTIDATGAHTAVLSPELAQAVKEGLQSGEPIRDTQPEALSKTVRQQLQLIFDEMPGSIVTSGGTLLAAWDDSREEMLLTWFVDTSPNPSVQLGWQFRLVPKDCFLHYDDGVEVAQRRQAVEKARAELQDFDRSHEGDLRFIAKKIADLEQDRETKIQEHKQRREYFLASVQTAEKALARAEREEAANHGSDT